MGEWGDFECVHVLYVEVVGFDVCDLVPTWGKCGKHERRWLGGVASELAEISGGDILKIIQKRPESTAVCSAI